MRLLAPNDEFLLLVAQGLKLFSFLMELTDMENGIFLFSALIALPCFFNHFSFQLFHHGDALKMLKALSHSLMII